MPDKHIVLGVSTRFDKQTGRWISGSPELDVWSSGRSPKEALDRVDEAILLFLEQATEMGTIRDILRNAGIRLLDKIEPDLAEQTLNKRSFPLSFPVHATVGTRTS